MGVKSRSTKINAVQKLAESFRETEVEIKRTNDN